MHGLSSQQLEGQNRHCQTIKLDVTVTIHVPTSELKLHSHTNDIPLLTPCSHVQSILKTIGPKDRTAPQQRSRLETAAGEQMQASSTPIASQARSVARCSCQSTENAPAGDHLLPDSQWSTHGSPSTPQDAVKAAAGWSNVMSLLHSRPGEQQADQPLNHGASSPI